MAALQNASFISPLVQASFAKLASPSVLDDVFSTITGLSGWTIALTVFLGLVLYDQCKYEFLCILIAPKLLFHTR
jgi:sterol 22-desaturase